MLFIIHCFYANFFRGSFYYVEAFSFNERTIPSCKMACVYKKKEKKKRKKKIEKRENMKK